MNILHVTPHLGGGIGKAHAALSAILPADIERTFLLLEDPRDRRYADIIAAKGHNIVITRELGRVAAMAAAADIVQFEFWNHPRLLECLARTVFPPMRSLYWSHISGLFRPIIQPGLIEASGRFVFSTTASLSIPWLSALSESAREKIAVVNSGFGFERPQRQSARNGAMPKIAYLGTVDFVKMHAGVFDVIDRLEGDFEVSVWGDIDPAGAVAARARAMHYPGRIKFRGQTAEPAKALSEADILFYPLQPEHYGTAENALVEAMSLGLVPIVMNNPSEAEIVRHGHTGFVAQSIDECAALLQMLFRSPNLLEQVSQNAMRDVAETKSPANSAQQFTTLWQKLLGEPKRTSKLSDVFGKRPSDWYLATQCLPGEWWGKSEIGTEEAASKGALSHFESVFPGDESLSVLRSRQMTMFQ